MPTYEFKCPSPRGHETIELALSYYEDIPELFCGVCNTKMIRVYGTFGIQFNGNGFYKTDNRRR